VVLCFLFLVFDVFCCSSSRAACSSSESGTSGINKDPSLGNSNSDGATVEACRLATGILGDARGTLLEVSDDSAASVRSYCERVSHKSR
jgi:hypothetical protein